MEKCGSDGGGGDTFARRMYIACRYTAAVQPAIQKWGTSNPNTGNSSNDRL